MSENSTHKSSSQVKNIPDSVIISPIYPDSVYFVVNAELGNITEVKGKVEGFHTIAKNKHEIYFQRFVEKQGQLRVIHAAGNSIETILEYGKEKSNMQVFNDTIRFDELGYFDGEPGDPVDLIPLYPGHSVKPGEYWTPEAPVKLAMGDGTAKYKFVIDSLYSDDQRSLLAHISVDVNAVLEPSPAFKAGRVTVSGGGWLIWDCTINQRRETHIEAVYHGVKGRNEVKQIITVNDKLKVYPCKKDF